MLTLEAGDYRLDLDPARGGAILRFDWRGQPLMRPVCGEGILDVACFPLVPFSNRIARGRFVDRPGAAGREVRLAPNFPGSDHPHTLHGFGWLASWAVVEREPGLCVIEHRHAPGEWPWAYTARQSLTLDPSGAVLGLSLCNEGDRPMPAGLGFHPYFPRDPDTVYRGAHRGEWTTSAEGLPLSLAMRETAVDWWEGAPAASRTVDTVYAGRVGDLSVSWPSRGYAVCMRPSPELDHTVVYTPATGDFLCVEPATHATDAINAGTMCWLAPGETMAVTLAIAAAQTP